MRHDLNSEARKVPDRFMALARQNSPSSTETICEHVQHFLTVQASQKKIKRIQNGSELSQNGPVLGLIAVPWLLQENCQTSLQCHCGTLAEQSVCL
jgi:hypothetical protein